MKTEEEINSLEAEIQFIQNEIDRRHSRIDEDVNRAHNLEKIDELRVKKNKLRERLDHLKKG